MIRGSIGDIPREVVIQSQQRIDDRHQGLLRRHIDNLPRYIRDWRVQDRRHIQRSLSMDDRMVQWLGYSGYPAGYPH
jgi:hypothetical protein